MSFSSLLSSVGGAFGTATPAAGASVLGTGLDALGSLYGGAAKSSAYKQSAAIAEQNAAITQQQGLAALEIQRQKAAKTQGSLMAGYGASGIQGGSGSAMDVLAESARAAMLDKLTLKYNYDMKALNYQEQASAYKEQASSALTSSLLTAGASGLKGYGKFQELSQGTPIPGVIP